VYLLTPSEQNQQQQSSISENHEGAHVSPLVRRLFIEFSQHLKGIYRPARRHAERFQTQISSL
jgi:hypothetical protein